MNSVKGNRKGEKKETRIKSRFYLFFFFFFCSDTEGWRFLFNLSLCEEECKKGEMYLTRRFTLFKRNPQGYFGGRCPKLALQKSRCAWKSLLHEYMICRRLIKLGLISRMTGDMPLKVRLHFYSTNSLWYVYNICPLIYCCCAHGTTFTNWKILLCVLHIFPQTFQ